MVDEERPLQSLIRRAPLVGLCALLGAGAALGWSLVQEENRYSATAEVLDKPTRTPGVPAWRAGTYRLELVQREAVARRVADQLGGDFTAAKVQEKVSVEGNTDTGLFTMTATDSDRQFAAELANAYAEKARQVLPSGAQVAERARVPGSGSSPGVVRSTAVGAVLGLVLGAVVALLLGRFDRRVRSPEELGEASGLPVLASVPESRSLASFLQGKGSNKGSLAPLPFVEAEAFRMLGIRLRYLDSGRDLRSVVVTSALPGEGKTTVAANLAMAQAATGSSVCLIEADLRKPAFAQATGLRELPGLAEVLSGQSAPAEAVQRLTADANGEATRHLDLIVAGTVPPNPVELMESRRMATLVDDLSDRYDLVVIDTPPPIVLADAIPLLKLADGVLVVAQVGRITQDEVARLREELQGLDARVVGVVANRTPKSREARYGEHYRSDRAPTRVRLHQDTGSQPGRGDSGTKESPTASPAPRGGEPAGSG